MTPEQIAELRSKRYNATVAYLKKVHSDLMIMRVQPDNPVPPHKPGQYTSLGLGNWEPRMPGCQEEVLKEEDRTKLVRRAYSMSCSIIDSNDQLQAEQKPWIEFYIVLVRETDNPNRAPGLTPRLFMLREGDRLNMLESCKGAYTLDGIKPTDTIIFLATGTGEAPHNYMLWELLRNQHQGKILSACCVRYQRDLAYLDIHRKLEARYPNYKYLSLTTRENVGTRKVYIQDLILSGQLEEELGQKLNPESTHVYLCGNPKMIGVPVKDKETGERKYPAERGVIEILEQRGFKADYAAAKFRGNIHFEEYW
jgi:ferredoxin--NADP+ reductase